jgi:hypothetical protein
MDAVDANSKGPIVNGKATEVTVLLRNADRLVKEGNLTGALAAIAQARSLDPKNPYAVAYEDRVQSLLKEQKRRESAETARDAGPAGTVSASSHGPAKPPPRESDEDRRKREADDRQRAIDEKISSLTASAEQYRAKKEFQRGMEELSRAALLAPDNAAIKTLREQFGREMEQEQHRQDEERKRRLQENEQRKQLLVAQQAEKQRKEKQERELREEEARRKAQQEKVRQYLERSSGFLAADKFDAALNELKFVGVIDPANEEAAALHAAVRQRQDVLRREEEERIRQREEEQRRRREALEQEIERQCAEALGLAEEGKTGEALLVITRAYVIDPASEKIRQCEQQILAKRDQAVKDAEERRKAEEEEERKKAEEELERLAREEQERIAREQAAEEQRRQLTKEQIHEHLGTARFELSQQRFEEALAEVAKAFLLDPFDEDIKQLEEEILAAQGEEVKPDERDFLPPEQGEEEGLEAVGPHLEEARRLMQLGDFDHALEELTRAFIIDPLDEGVKTVEHELDMLRFGTPDTATAEPQPAEAREATAMPVEAPVAVEEANETVAQRATRFFERRLYEEALAEIALGRLDAPDDPALTELERAIWEAQNENRPPASPPKSEQAQRADEDRARLLQLHLMAADEFQKQNNFVRALDEIAKAYVIDPLSPEVKKLEVRIRQNQSRQNPASANALKLVYPHGKTASGSR